MTENPKKEKKQRLIKFDSKTLTATLVNFNAPRFGSMVQAYVAEDEYRHDGVLIFRKGDPIQVWGVCESSKRHGTLFGWAEGIAE